MASQIPGSSPFNLSTDQQEVVRAVMKHSEAERFINTCNTAVAETAEKSFEKIRTWYDASDGVFREGTTEGRAIINDIIDSLEKEAIERVKAAAGHAFGTTQLSSTEEDKSSGQSYWHKGYNRKAFAEIKACFRSTFGSDKKIPYMQRDGSWTTGRFFEFAHHLNVAAKADIRGEAIKNYNTLVPEEDRIKDPMSREEQVKYPAILYNCLGDQVWHHIRKRDAIDPELEAAASVFLLFDYEYNEEVFSKLQDEDVFRDVAMPDKQRDGSWTTGRFFVFAHHLNVAASADIRGEAIKNYNQLVPEEDRINDPMGREESVTYPFLFYQCLKDQVLYQMKARDGIDPNLGAAAAVFNIEGKEVEPRARQTWDDLRSRLEKPDDTKTGFPVDFEALKRLEIACNIFDDDLPHVAPDGTYTMGRFFNLTHEMNVLASADIRGDAVATYNKFVPKEARIEDAMNRDSVIAYPLLFTVALVGATLQVFRRRESIDAQFGAFLSFFEIDPAVARSALPPELAYKEIWAETEIADIAQELFLSSSVGIEYSKHRPGMSIKTASDDGTISLADFNSFLRRLNRAISSDITKVVIDKYNAVVEDERFQITDPFNKDAVVFFPNALITCCNSAVRELAKRKTEEGEELSKDFLAALFYFDSYHDPNPSEGMESSMIRISMEMHNFSPLPTQNLIKLAEEYAEVHDLLRKKEVSWGEFNRIAHNLGRVLAQFDFCHSVRKKYTAASGQNIKGFKAEDKIIINKDALINALDAAIHEAAKKHPKSETIAKKTYQYLVTENPNPRDRARYEARSREEGFAFGLNHCADDKRVLSRILQEFAEARNHKQFVEMRLMARLRQRRHRLRRE